MTIGQPEGYYTNAIIDEVDIFDRALDPSEIASIYAAGSAGKCIPTPSSLGMTLNGLATPTGEAVCTNMFTGQTISMSVKPNISMID